MNRRTFISVFINKRGMRTVKEVPYRVDGSAGDTVIINKKEWIIQGMAKVEEMRSIPDPSIPVDDKNKGKHNQNRMIPVICTFPVMIKEESKSFDRMNKVFKTIELIESEETPDAGVL